MLRLIRQREKVLKSAAKQRRAELLADFENQMGSELGFDDSRLGGGDARCRGRDREGKRKIAARCRELGIPSQFSPTMKLYWTHRGYDNLVEERRRELRGIAEAKIEAIEKKAITEIEMSCLQAQTELDNLRTDIGSGASLRNFPTSTR